MLECWAAGTLHGLQEPLFLASEEQLEQQAPVTPKSESLLTHDQGKSQGPNSGTGCKAWSCFSRATPGDV